MHCQWTRSISSLRRRRRVFLPLLFLSCFWIALFTEKGIVSGFPIDGNKNNAGLPPPILPEDPEAMIRQASAAIRSALEDGDKHRQTIRLPLSESMYGDKEESFVADRAIGWQGGPQETFRFVSPISQQLMKDVVSGGGADTSGLAPKLQEQILLDFDGSSLLNAQSPMGAKKDGIALLQPNTDKYYMDLIQRLENDFSDTPDRAKRLFLLINPAWRDASSFGIFQEKYARERIIERYETTYAIDQFVVKGNKLSLLKAWPCDWCVYYTPLPQPGSATKPPPKLLGTFTERPEYSQIEDLTRKGY